MDDVVLEHWNLIQVVISKFWYGKSLRQILGNGEWKFIFQWDCWVSVFFFTDSFLWGSNRQSWGAFPLQYVVEFWNSRCPRKHINTSLTRDGLNDIRLTPPPLSHLTDFSVGWTFQHIYIEELYLKLYKVFQDKHLHCGVGICRRWILACYKEPRLVKILG